jgi:hypothetical protein
LPTAQKAIIVLAASNDHVLLEDTVLLDLKLLNVMVLVQQAIGVLKVHGIAHSWHVRPVGMVTQVRPQSIAREVV